MLYARIDRDTEKRQTLIDHLNNVSDFLGKSCSGLGIGALAGIIALLHDMGKASAVWQDKLEKNIHGYPHAYAGAKWIYQKYGTGGTSIERQTAEYIAMAVWSHHGRLRDCASVNCELTYPDQILLPRGEADEYKECIYAFFTECVNEDKLDTLFAQACAELRKLKITIKERFSKPELSGEDCADASFFALGLMERFLYSLLIDADRYDAANFPNRIPEPEPAPSWEQLLSNLEKRLTSIEPEDSSKEIFKLRKEISDECYAFAGNSAGIYRLNVPTGGGKTFSALRYALRFAKINGSHHIFFIEPYLTIIEQNANDCRSALNCNTEVLLEHHSNIIFNPNDDKGEDPVPRIKLMTERWEAPLIFTTMVQFLNALFSGESQSARRMNALYSSVIIIDEAQNIPVRMLYMFNTAMRFLHYICGCTVVLCTATQPALETVRYPITLSAPADMYSGYKTAFIPFRRTILTDRTDIVMTAEQTAEFALSLLGERKSVLVIVNTKKAALKVYKKIKASDEKAYHLSTSMCAAHRKTVIDEIKEKLKSDERMICVSTQLIEAGINISFSCVVRSLAGLDSIAQAAGRCNRHGKDPIPHEVYIIRCSDENVDKLDDIAIGQRATERLLRDFKKHPKHSAEICFRRQLSKIITGIIMKSAEAVWPIQ